MGCIGAKISVKLRVHGHRKANIMLAAMMVRVYAVTLKKRVSAVTVLLRFPAHRKVTSALVTMMLIPLVIPNKQCTIWNSFLCYDDCGMRNHELYSILRYSLSIFFSSELGRRDSQVAGRAGGHAQNRLRRRQQHQCQSEYGSYRFTLGTVACDYRLIVKYHQRWS